MSRERRWGVSTEKGCAGRRLAPVATGPSIRVESRPGLAGTFHAVAHRYAELAGPEVASFEPGDHTDGYWRRVLPAVLDFVAAHLTGA